MIPTSIDGTDITGATIDGTDVQEITVDGQTVFSAGANLPVAYSNLVAWYPFESATYGGSNADDVTAIIGGSGDDTAYDGTVNGATYQSSGGVTDIRAGANSGTFDFDGNNDTITSLIPANLLANSSFTIMVWVNEDIDQDNKGFLGDNDVFLRSSSSAQSGNVEFAIRDLGSFDTFSGSLSGWVHYAGTFDGSTTRVFANAQQGTSDNVSGSFSHGEFEMGRDNGKGTLDGRLDDARIYNRALTSTEINQIYQNTEP